jgi:hypothetical protein
VREMRWKEKEQKRRDEPSKSPTPPSSLEMAHGQDPCALLHDPTTLTVDCTRKWGRNCPSAPARAPTCAPMCPHCQSYPVRGFWPLRNSGLRLCLSLDSGLCFQLWTLFPDHSMYFLPAIGPLTLFWTLQTSLRIYVHILAPSSCIISHSLDRWGLPLYLRSAVDFRLF